MSEQGSFGDEVYQPQPDEGALDDSGELDLEDTLDSKGLDDVLDEGYSPPERPRGMDKFGTTAAEERQGESLDQRLAQEEPEWQADDGSDGIGDSSDSDGEPLDDQVGYRRSGRLVAPDEGAHSDTEKDVVARDVGIDGGAASAEEAAMHVVDEDDLR